ncbi:MAG: tRNA preQ1(34) S-adenosylmethionine ribosyltransferase-isomerase QueA [Chitinophagales bacterium]|jgi:S-adenosylmethionine:tRNA ribosyltransferase-isomerase|nr:tRNA preQ1(34) S-adenosylmethionine ribosyltransferase-isomerase QueA [Chitinophagales bacterium]
MSEIYKLSQFEYNLPEERIARFPSKERGGSRMMVIDRAKNTIEHKQFTDIIDYFGDGDTIVMNNTKVIPARLWATKEKTRAKIEVFLLRELNKEQLIWDVIVDPARKIRVGNKIYFGKDDILVAEVIDNTTSRGRTLRFFYDGYPEDFRDYLFSFGETPIPRYITKFRPVEESDSERYQTIIAKEIGAVAAPTAGLHFSREILKRLQIKGAEITELTLHTGLGSFSKIDVEDLTKHRMDTEYFKINAETVELVNESKKNNKKVLSVGTTTLRALESSVTSSGMLKEGESFTNLFIYPPYEFNVPNCLLTNFHLPSSSLLILTCSFGGYDLIMEAYRQAVAEKYNFYSYGDCMLIL